MSWYTTFYIDVLFTWFLWPQKENSKIYNFLVHHKFGEKKFGGQTWIEVDSGQNSENYGIHILNLREVEVIEAQKH